MIFRPILLPAVCGLLAFALTGCLTQRTVTDGGATVSQEIVVKRPLKTLIDNSE